jgi:alkylation response protein AidB-like acyl-CoA dehydrogenase
MSESSTATHDDLRDELRSWLEQNWDPDLTVGDWWERLGLAGWVAPAWPSAWFGRDLSTAEANVVSSTIAEFGALGAPGGLGLLLAGPTIVTHGTDDQKRRYLRDIVTGQRAWCQLFSEPNAGSDLAGLQTRALLDGDEWIVSGQKVWTSGGQAADLGMLIARTNPDAPKHQGISYFALDMHQDGIDIRPLREITGRALFNEVFLTDARTHDDTVIGGLNNGWAVANTTLTFERAGLGAGGGSSAASAAIPGQVAGQLPMRAGDFVPASGGKRRGGGGGGGMFGSAERMLVGLARDNGAIDDPTVRQDLARLHTLNEIARFSNLRMKAAKAAGKSPGPIANTAKLSMSKIVRLTRDVGLRILGGYGTLHAYEGDQRKSLDAAVGRPLDAMVTEMSLFSPAPSIYGGTDEIQKNIIGERVLGLPKEPNQDRTTPFKELLKN